MYAALIALHILAAVVWVGGAIVLQILAVRAKRSGELARMATVATEAEWVGTRLFLPSSLIIVVTGFALVAVGDVGWPLWVIVALAAWSASFLTGAFFAGPESGRIGRLLAGPEASLPSTTARIDRLFVVARIETTLLVLVVLDMTLKPS